MIEQWIQQIKADCPPDALGMILIHNGIVRATGKDGAPVRAMKLSFDRDKLEDRLADYRRQDGIVAIRVWINEGMLQVGDDIMKVCVAGRFRTDVLPVFESLLKTVKTEIVREQEL
jgi:molybdopterin synthase catalytic subunit